MELYKEKVNIISLPCAGLVELIESGIIEGQEIENYLLGKLKEFMQIEIGAIVLGCTHYPFIKNELFKIVGDKTVIIDGSKGTVNQLKRQLTKNDFLNEKKTKGVVSIYSSSVNNYTVDLCYKLLKS